MTRFFETSANDTAKLKSLRDVHASNTVVALYGLTCIPRGEGLCELKASPSFFWEVASGTYAKLARLQAGARETVASPAIITTKEWPPTHSANKNHRRTSCVFC